MSRTIEFRAWLPHAKKTVWSDHGTVEQCQPDARRRGRMVEFDELTFDISDDSLEHPRLFTDTAEHFYGEDIEEAAREAVLLQFTGRTDKDGVEIYEGDVATACGRLEDPLTGVVIWDEEWGGWSLEYLPNPMNYQRGHSIEREWENDLIIGNIYENGDLLQTEVV